MYCTDREPADFGTLIKVLINNYWPRVADPEVTDLGSARTAMTSRKINARTIPKKSFTFRNSMVGNHYVQKW